MNQRNGRRNIIVKGDIEEQMCDPKRVSRRSPHLRPLGWKRKLKPLELLARLVLVMKSCDPPGVVHFASWCVAVEGHGYDAAKVLLEVERMGWMRLCKTAETKQPMVVLTKEGYKL